MDQQIHSDKNSGVPKAAGFSLESGAFLKVEALDEVAPLGDTFGEDAAQTVPDALRGPLFGQPVPSEQQIAEWGNLDVIPDLGTYVVLDAARIDDLAEMLGRSGLTHRCLFQGDAASELRDVAPYLVQLELGNNFTRLLFTHLQDFGGDHVALHLWPRAPGPFIRSRAGFNAVWSHMRKFTRLQDAQGRWFYFRYWETGYGALFFAGNPDLMSEIGAKFGGVIDQIYCQGGDRRLWALTPDLPQNPRRDVMPANLVSHYLPIFGAYKWHLFLASFVPRICAKCDDRGILVTTSQVSGLAENARSEGVDRESQIEAYIFEALAEPHFRDLVDG